MTVSGSGPNKSVQDLKAEFLMCFLPAFEAQLEAHFHIIAKKLDGMSELHSKIVRIDHRAELHLFHLATVSALGFFVFLGFLVAEFTVVHDAAYRRRGRGGNLDEVQSFALGQAQGIAQSHDPELLFLLIYDANFARANLAVSAMLRFSWLVGT